MSILNNRRVSELFDAKNTLETLVHRNGSMIKMGSSPHPDESLKQLFLIEKMAIKTAPNMVNEIRGLRIASEKLVYGKMSERSFILKLNVFSKRHGIPSTILAQLNQTMNKVDALDDVPKNRSGMTMDKIFRMPNIQLSNKKNRKEPNMDGVKKLFGMR